MWAGEKLRRGPHQGPSPPSFHHFLTRPGAVPGSQRIKGQSRLVNYNHAPLGGAGQGVRRIPRPTPKAWGGGVPKETGFLQKILMGVGEDRRSRSVLRANRKMSPQEETRITHSKWTRTPPSRRFPKINWVHQLPGAWSTGCAVASLKLSAHLCPLQG